MHLCRSRPAQLRLIQEPGAHEHGIQWLQAQKARVPGPALGSSGGLGGIILGVGGPCLSLAENTSVYT